MRLGRSVAVKARGGETLSRISRISFHDPVPVGEKEQLAVVGDRRIAVVARAGDQWVSSGSDAREPPSEGSAIT